ncbi:type IIL restriction-modification enzyme MmeI, partial [Oleiphilus sp. HI0067]
KKIHANTKKYIFEYDDVKGLPHKINAKKINCYLVDASNILIENRTKPISNVKPIVKGCEATDDGHLTFTEEEKIEFLNKEPNSAKYFRRLRGGKDLIAGRDRWCLWLKNAHPSEIKKMPLVVDRINKVKQFRLNSPKDQTVKKASTPYLFGEIRLSDTGDSIAIPKVSSERRLYAPISFVDHDVILNNTVQFIPNGSLYEFGLVQS